MNDFHGEQIDEHDEEQCQQHGGRHFPGSDGAERVSVKIACDEVIQMKKRKMTVPWDSSNGMRRTPCVTNR